MPPRRINKMKKAMAPLGLNDSSNSASVMWGRAFACTSSVVSMKKNFVQAKLFAATGPADDVKKEEI